MPHKGTWNCEDCGMDYPNHDQDEVVVFVVVKKDHLNLMAKDLGYTLADLEQDQLEPHSPYTVGECNALQGYYYQLRQDLYAELEKVNTDKKPDPG